MATRGLGKGPKSAPKKKVVAAKPAVKKTAAKTASKKPAAAKKAQAKKSAPAKKTATKKPVAKAPAKKSVTAKKTAAVKSSAPKAAPAKKTAVKTISESKAMGRGLGALLSSDGIPENKRDSVVDLKINDISPNNGQPRKNFNDDALNELASSIEENGVIQPIIVQRKGEGYRIVAGERRWRAARIAGLSVIPAIVRDLSDKETMAQALIENIQREDLNPIEEASAMDNLLKTHKLTQEQLAKKLGKPRATIATGAGDAARRRDHSGTACRAALEVFLFMRFAIPIAPVGHTRRHRWHPTHFVPIIFGLRFSSKAIA